MNRIIKTSAPNLGLTVRPELVEGWTVKPFMVRQGSPERSRRAHYERLNLKFPCLIVKSKFSILSVLLLGSLLPTAIQAAPRAADGNNKVVVKLQTIVRDMTAERDLLKTEKDKLASEIEQVKKEKSAAVSAASSVEERLSGELAAQKSSSDEVRNKLEQTHAKLLEVIEKYNALNKAKNELSALHVNLENTQKQTETNLQSCEGKNIKMFEAAKEVLNSYENKGVMDSLLKAEPVLQFKSVEMESIIQEYEDKLIKQKYQHKDIAATNNTTLEPKEPQ